jgi:hypothetical protein
MWAVCGWIGPMSPAVKDWFDRSLHCVHGDRAIRNQMVRRPDRNGRDTGGSSIFRTVANDLHCAVGVVLDAGDRRTFGAIFVAQFASGWRAASAIEPRR